MCARLRGSLSREEEWRPEGRSGMNRNVRLSSLLAAVSGLARSVWGNAVLAAYLYELTGGSNSKAGLADTV